MSLTKRQISNYLKKFKRVSKASLYYCICPLSSKHLKELIPNVSDFSCRRRFFILTNKKEDEFSCLERFNYLMKNCIIPNTIFLNNE